MRAVQRAALERSPSIESRCNVLPAPCAGIYLNGGGGFHSSGIRVDAMPDGWHHLTVVADGSGTSFYLNLDRDEAGGKRRTRIAQQSRTEIGWVGSCRGSQAWGTFARLRVLSTAMGADEVGALHARGAHAHTGSDGAGAGGDPKSDADAKT